MLVIPDKALPWPSSDIKNGSISNGVSVRNGVLYLTASRALPTHRRRCTAFHHHLSMFMCLLTTASCRVCTIGRDIYSAPRVRR